MGVFKASSLPSHLCIQAEQSQSTDHAAIPPARPYHGQKAAYNKVGTQILKTSSSTFKGR